MSRNTISPMLNVVTSYAIQIWEHAMLEQAGCGSRLAANHGQQVALHMKASVWMV